LLFTALWLVRVQKLSELGSSQHINIKKAKLILGSLALNDIMIGLASVWRE
jgi:hypothetical protein